MMEVQTLIWRCVDASKNVAGVGICGCMKSLKPFENMVGKIDNMGGMFGCFGAMVGLPRAMDGEIAPP